MSGYTAITRAQLRTRLNARYESTPFWVTAEANNALNEALLTWGLLTGRWRRTEVLQTTANTYEYVLPATMTYRMSVSFDGRPLDVSNRFDLDHGRPRWRQETTASGGSTPTRPTLWAPISLQLIYIWPADAVGHHSLTVNGVSATPVLTADGQTVDLSEADLSLLLGFALHVLLFKKGGDAFQGTTPFLVEFVRAAAEENSLLSTSQFFRKFLGLDDRSFKPSKGVASPLTQVAQSLAGGQ